MSSTRLLRVVRTAIELRKWQRQTNQVFATKEFVHDAVWSKCCKLDMMSKMTRGNRNEKLQPVYAVSSRDQPQDANSGKNCPEIPVEQAVPLVPIGRDHTFEPPRSTSHDQHYPNVTRSPSSQVGDDRFRSTLEAILSINARMGSLRRASPP